jgi:uncharacterized repeat protein (TIGR03806 family)
MSKQSLFYKMKASRLLFTFLAFLSICVYNFACRAVSKHPTQIDFSKMPLKSLEEYGLLSGDLKNLKPNTGVLEYEPIAPLFTDYAHKLRYVWMPKGAAATFNVAKPNDPFTFPDQTILMKNFYYPEDFTKPDADKRIIETRLLIKTDGEWKSYPYVWNEDQTNAAYKITGGSTNVHYIDENKSPKDLKYNLLNKNQCKSCHNYNGAFQPIGPKIKQLNNTFTYQDGKAQNQLEKWTQMGYLKGYDSEANYPALVSMLDTKATTAQKARSYLDTNCGHCHNPAGPAATSGLHLNVEEQDPFHYGVLKSPVAAGMGAGQLKFAINRGHGQESIIHYRMNSLHPGVMMPEIGRVSIHKEGVELIKEWIDRM